ncbi:MAG TPA: GNA1162 family protein, partial [Planctomycetota bacterium]|nr:GNA1162 family protein [Planctomycetota bacterium]
MRASRALPALLATAALLLGGCKSLSVDARRDPSFHPTASSPIRVAVLRFDDKTGGTSPLLYPFLPFIWLASAITLQVPEATPDPAKGAETLRALLIARLRGSALNVVDPATVDNTLGHAGLLWKESSVDARELGRLLKVDAICYGTLEGWSGRYYVVESHTVVEATVRLVSCVDGLELFRATVAVTDAAGVSGGPTGYISAAATPLAALGSGPYRRLAIDWNEAVGMELIGAYSSDAAASAEPAPYITNVAPHTPPPDGYKPGDVVEVLAIGSPGCRASFDLGTLRIHIPMVETGRSSRTGVLNPTETSGVYQGAYVVDESDHLRDAPITVTLESRSGRVTQEAPGARISIAPV